MADAQDRQNEEQVNGNTSDAVNNTTGAENGGNNGGAVSAESQRIAELEAQLAQAKQQAAENWNKFLRERAEMDNFRKRQERLAQERLQREKKALFEKVLGVIDNVERALAYQETMDKQGLQQALRMLMWQMNEVMRGEGVTPIPSVGEHFNPYVHEAIEAVEDSDQPEGTIVEEVQKGYKFGDETLRPARVRVSAGNKQSSESSTQAQS
ncbi:MAG TPA: nucleotide exchange factor GrpE [Ktedonobacteraceae bacterium]|jgi:molecular chaperone GrpE|nr:nucleotide exchange factor GrpE [Ktedonobacteraceae bacterium]